MKKILVGIAVGAFVAVSSAGIAEAAPSAAPAFVPPKAADCNTGGSGYAPPGGGWGDVSQGICAAGGSPGTTMKYSYTSRSDASPIHATGRHYTNIEGPNPGPEAWTEFGFGTRATSNPMPWGNAMAYKAMRFQSVNVLGAIVDWS